MVAVLSSGLTYAYFNDTETSPNNSFTAGTLDLKINNADDPVPATFTATNLAPGSHGNAKMTVSNAGSIGGALTGKISAVTNSGGSNPEPEKASGTDNGELGAAMTVTIYIDANNNGAYDAGETLYYNTNPAVSGSWNMGTLAAGSAIEVSVSYNIPTTVGNEIMGDICTFSIEYALLQTS
jgi:predicted ribosomally synthesized peptide with SipW-like signal peptide